MIGVDLACVGPASLSFGKALFKMWEPSLASPGAGAGQQFGVWSTGLGGANVDGASFWRLFLQRTCAASQYNDALSECVPDGPNRAEFGRGAPQRGGRRDVEHLGSTLMAIAVQRLVGAASA